MVPPGRYWPGGETTFTRATSIPGWLPGTVATDVALTVVVGEDVATEVAAGLVSSSSVRSGLLVADGFAELLVAAIGVVVP